MVFVDPYWMGSETGALSAEALAALLRQVAQLHQIERVYVYQESVQMPKLRALDVPVTIRPCASDSLDDGFELIRAMDQDMQQIATARACDCLVVVSMDDRLALSVERIKSYGLRVIGVAQGSGQESQAAFKRMGLVFDHLLRLSELAEPAGASHGVGINAAAAEDVALGTLEDETSGQASEEAIESALVQWFEESDEITRDGVLEFMNNRRGLPKHVDSRLLFLCSKALGRELSEPEKIALRGRFRQAASDRSSSMPT